MKFPYSLILITDKYITRIGIYVKKKGYIFGGIIYHLRRGREERRLNDRTKSSLCKALNSEQASSLIRNPPHE